MGGVRLEGGRDGRACKTYKTVIRIELSLLKVNYFHFIFLFFSPFPVPERPVIDQQQTRYTSSLARYSFQSGHTVGLQSGTEWGEILGYWMWERYLVIGDHPRPKLSGSKKP